MVELEKEKKMEGKTTKFATSDEVARRERRAGVERGECFDFLRRYEHVVRARHQRLALFVSCVLTDVRVRGEDALGT